MKHTPGPWAKDYNGSIGHIKAINGPAHPSVKGMEKTTPTICRYDGYNYASRVITDYWQKS
jgi:hypothetical protein